MIVPLSRLLWTRLVMKSGIKCWYVRILKARVATRFTYRATYKHFKYILSELSPENYFCKHNLSREPMYSKT